MSDPTPSKTLRSKAPPRGWVKARRSPIAFQATPPSRWRRTLRYVFNGWTLSIAGILLLVAFLTLTYYWFDFSERIDQRLLSGEVFTASAGIYSAPKTLKVGENTTMPALIDYLKTAGYIERNAQAPRVILSHARNRFLAQRLGAAVKTARWIAEGKIRGVVLGKTVD